MRTCVAAGRTLLGEGQLLISVILGSVLVSVKDCIMNSPERPEYALALSALKEILFNLPFKIIVIDGRPGVGKTTLGRFLAWRFNISLVETDLFLVQQQGHYIFRNTALNSVIGNRRAIDRPVIIEGVTSLAILSELKLNFDFHIHVTCEDAVSSVLPEYSDYLRMYNPCGSADLILDLPALKRN